MNEFATRRSPNIGGPAASTLVWRDRLAGVVPGKKGRAVPMAGLNVIAFQIVGDLLRAPAGILGPIDRTSHARIEARSSGRELQGNRSS